MPLCSFIFHTTDDRMFPKQSKNEISSFLHEKYVFLDITGKNRMIAKSYV